MKLKHMIQVGIVTDDLQASIKEFQKFGFDEWQPMPFDSTKLPGVLIDGGSDTELHMDIAVFNDENMEIELIQPLCEGVFMDWLKEHGTGIHHLAFRPVGGYPAFMEDYEKYGYETLIDVSSPDGTKGFTYLDTVKQLGFYAEIHRGEPGKPGDQH